MKEYFFFSYQVILSQRSNMNNLSIDKISIHEIEKKLSSKTSITFFETTDSTNLRLKEEANASEGQAVIIAENQTAGRGRLGRSFFSPSHSGIYMSLLLRPDHNTDIGLITAYTAVAVCEALETVCDYKFEIKWVNDIIKKGKKVCGILAESCVEQGELKYIIVGIGINAYTPEEGFPEEIENIATSIFDAPVENGRNRIIAEIINRFYSYDKNFLTDYKNRSCVVGKEVYVHKRGETKEAFAFDIDEKCNLWVRYKDGSEEALSFGEISVRTKKN